MTETSRQYGIAGAQAGEIDQGLRAYMLGVYNYMALGVALTALVTMYVMSTPSLLMAIAAGPFKWVVFAVVLGLGFLAPRMIFSGSKVMAHATFWLYAVSWGALIAPMIHMFMSSGAVQDVYRAFFITATVFGSMSLIGYTTKRDLTGMASFLSMAAIGLLVAMLLNAFIFKSGMGSMLISFAVVLVFSGITAYETQMIKSLYREGGEENGRASIFGAFALYGSFITLFIHILNIMGIMRSD